MSDAKSAAPVAISGIDVMRGVGAQKAKSFWADAWDRVVGRFGARVALAWIAIVAFFAVFGPVVANAHPLLRTDRATGAWDSPLWQNLTSVDLALLAAAVFGVPFAFLPQGLATAVGMPLRSSRLGLLFLVALPAGFTIVVAGIISSVTRDNDSAPWMRQLGQASWFPWAAAE